MYRRAPKHTLRTPVAIWRDHWTPLFAFRPPQAIEHMYADQGTSEIQAPRGKHVLHKMNPLIDVHRDVVLIQPKLRHRCSTNTGRRPAPGIDNGTISSYMEKEERGHRTWRRRSKGSEHL